MVVQNEEQRTFSKYANPSITITQGSIVRIMVPKKNFELKPTFRLMVQGIIDFDGLINEGPNANIASFMELCDMLKINGY